MVGDRALRYPKLGRHLAVGEALSGEERHLPLADGKDLCRFDGQRLVRRERCGWSGLIPGEGILGGFFERHRSPLGQCFLPQLLPKPGTGGGQIGLVQRPLAG
jgi:hypothetical protein